MRDDSLRLRSSRPRPLADAPTEELVASAEELARRWAIALILARPLEQMAAVPLEQIARTAPAVCVALARALASDEALEAFAPDAGSSHEPARSVGSAIADLDALTAGWDGPTAAANLEALRGVLWEAALDRLREPTARVVADLSDRLAFVSTVLLRRVLARKSGSAQGAGAPTAFAMGGEQVLYSAPGPSPGQPGAVLIDERGATPPDPEPGASCTAPRPLPWDTPLQPAPSSADPAAHRSEPAMRVSRGPGAPVERRS